MLPGCCLRFGLLKHGPLPTHLLWAPRLQGESSEDEGPAAATTPRSGGAPGRRGSKGGRELKRLQMWAWERRGRESGSSSDEEVSGSGGLGGAEGPRWGWVNGIRCRSRCACLPSSHRGLEAVALFLVSILSPVGRLSARPRADESDSEQQKSADKGLAAKQQQQQQQPKQEPKQEAKQETTEEPAAKQEEQKIAAKGAPNAAAQPVRQQQPAAAVAEPSPRSPPGSSDAKQLVRCKQQGGAAAPAAGPQQQQQQVKVRPAPKPAAPLEECDVFGRLGPLKKQPSGMLPLPTSPRAAAAAGGSKPAAAVAVALQPQQPQQQGAAKAAGDDAAKPAAASTRAAAGTPAAGGAAPAADAAKQAALPVAAQAEQQRAANGSGTPPGLPAVAVPAAAVAADVAPAVGHKPVLSPLKRKLLERTGAGGRPAAASPTAASSEAAKAELAAAAAKGGAGEGEPAAKRQHVEAGPPAAAAPKE